MLLLIGGGPLIYKTIALKIHQPSQKKQKLMDDAMLRYAIALEFLLANMKKSVEKKQPLEITKSLMDRLNAFRVEPFKDSLRKDAKAILSS